MANYRTLFISDVHLGTRAAQADLLLDFLKLDLPGRKVVVGDGPDLAELTARYPDVLFTKKKTGEELAECYSSADVFVFPSRTDTFGMVLLEAMASCLPVAAFPATGPIDIVTPGETGVLSEDLRAAALGARKLDRERVCAKAAEYSWEDAARSFVANITATCVSQQTPTLQMAALGLAKNSRRPLCPQPAAQNSLRT